MISFFCDEPLDAGIRRLDETAARHARARRVRDGDAARLLDGVGGLGIGRIVSASATHVDVRVDRVERVAAPPALDVIVPVADKDRMLWAAEKCAELQVSAWQPATYARSHSVTARGEGERFRERVRARMRSALEQSGGAWLPDVRPEDDALRLITSVTMTTQRLLLDAGGSPIMRCLGPGAVTIAAGPEGGLDAPEIDAAVASGWTLVSLGLTTLRFETAIVAGAAIVRAFQQSPRSD